METQRYVILYIYGMEGSLMQAINKLLQELGYRIARNVRRDERGIMKSCGRLGRTKGMLLHKILYFTVRKQGRGKRVEFSSSVLCGTAFDRHD